MTYLALSRKWRPRTFGEVIGQDHVLTALKNSLDRGRLHHAYLFSGTRGVGKTTLGRIFAKSLNCETGITSSPCSRCQVCKGVDDGLFVDLLEIDAASRTKVEDTRDLLDNVQYKPALGRFKVYLLDEVHMLSRHSLNALLKVLEEPPKYVKFLLATTDPQKLPPTITSRCLQFHLRPILRENIEHQIAHIFKQESVQYELSALKLLAHAAAGSMRDALSLSDQAIALSGEFISTGQVSRMLGTIGADQSLRVLSAISDSCPKRVVEQVKLLDESGIAWDELLKSLCEQLYRLALYQALPGTVEEDEPHQATIVTLSKSISPEEVQLYYQIALKGRKDLPFSPVARIGVEMVLLRMIAFKPSDSSPLNNIRKESNDKREEGESHGSPQLVETQQVAEEDQESIPSPASNERPGAYPPLIGLRRQLLSHRNRSKDEALSRKNDNTASIKKTVYDKSTHAPPDKSDVKKPQISVAIRHEKTPQMIAKLTNEVIEQDKWAKMISSMAISKLAEQLALNSSFEKQGTSVRLTLRPNHKHLNRERERRELHSAISLAAGEVNELDIILGEGGLTPLELREQKYQCRLSQAFESLSQDSTVHFLELRFGARLNKDTVRPV